jgi:ParB family chromosome partitioning protein
MGSDTKKTYGAVGRSDLLHFDPEDLLVVTDKDHPLFDERALKNPEERVIASIIKKGSKIKMDRVNFQFK